jgi:ABC-type transporter Mla subunit MlaD
MSAIFSHVPGFLDLGAWTTDIIRPLFHMFQDDNVAPALALVILLVALGLCALFLAYSTLIRAQVRRRIRAVSQIKDQTSFATEMPRVEALMLRCRYLRHSWQKFRETLVEPPSDDPSTNQVVYNTARPQTYFNMAEAGLRFSLYRATPNLLVGVGLLLTFFGLVTALYFTNEAIKHANSLAASQDALRDLLYAASFKFYTSIAGLGGSILLTLVLRYGTSKVESSFDTLAFALERKLVFVTPESIAFNHLREAQEQTKNLKLFNTEVALSIGKRIEEALAETLPTYLAQAMAPIGESLNNVATRLTSMNEGAIGQLAGTFVHELKGATGEQMNDLARTLEGLRSSLDDLTSRMNDSGAGLAEGVSRSTQQMRDAVGAMTASLSEAIERMAGRSEQAGVGFAAELANAATKFESASERTTSRMEEAVNAIARELLTKTAKIGENIAHAAAEAGNESRTKIVHAGDEVAQQLSGAGNQLADAVNRMREGLDAAVREMTNIERGIAHHVGAISQLSQAAQDTETAMLGTARSMREAGTPLADSSRLMAEATRMISQSTTSAEQTIAGALTEIRSTAQSLRTTLETTARQWHDYEQRFANVDTSLGTVLDRIIQAVHQNVDVLGTFVQRIDEKLSGVVDRLGGGIEDLGEFAQNMERVSHRFNGGGNGAAHPTP